MLIPRCSPARSSPGRTIQEDKIMSKQTYSVTLTLKPRAEVAREVAQAILMRANPHGQALIDEKLERAGINAESLAKYFVQVGQVVAEFWNYDWDKTMTPTLRSHEVRGLFLPLLMSVVYSQVGNIEVGNYRYLIKASTDVNVEKEFIIEFSAKLESMRQYIFGDVKQIGNYAAKPSDTVMLTILSAVSSDGREAEALVRDGVNVDDDLAGLAVLAGVTLVNEAYKILYTGEINVGFRRLIGTIKEKTSTSVASSD